MFERQGRSFSAFELVSITAPEVGHTGNSIIIILRWQRNYLVYLFSQFLTTRRRYQTHACLQTNQCQVWVDEAHIGNDDRTYV